MNLERDARTISGIQGYTLTSVGRDVLKSMARSLGGQAGQRAWSLTGPYGSGKSAFVLFASAAFGPDDRVGKTAREILREQAPDLRAEIYRQGSRSPITRHGYCPVLVGGSREPLLGALLRSAVRDVGALYEIGRRPQALERVEELHELFESGEPVSSSAVARALSALSVRLAELDRAQGLFIVIDELGKFLEYGARDPEHGDIFVLQQLAEYSAANDPATLLVVTVLHQAFDRYASDLRSGLRDEWAKIQGRFEDVAFQHPFDQSIELVSRAVNRNMPSAAKMEQRAEALARQAVNMGLVPPGADEDRFAESLNRCYPLHPLTVMLLARLSRKFGQNQRSLYSFLISRELNGFQAFLGNNVTEDGGPVFGLPELFDYVRDSLGHGLLSGEGGARWAEALATLDRAEDASLEEVAVLKSVGLLTAVGAYGPLKPSPEIIEFACPGSGDACQALLGKSILIERRHSGTIGFWQGSDIDLAKRLREASQKVAPPESLAKLLNETWKVRPLVAKRHSFQTGTLRYFEVRFADVSVLGKSLAPQAADADGLLLYCLPRNHGEFIQLCEAAENSEARERLDTLIAVPRETVGLYDSMRELQLLRWVQANTPELQGDAVARRELGSLIAAVSERVNREIHDLFGADRTSATRAAWYHHGLEVPVEGSRNFSSLLSDICDQVFESAPRLRNELINRRALSTAAAKARRNLIEAMICHAYEKQLGLKGSPPEVSMYASVLEQTGLHGMDEARHRFCGPSDADPSRIGPTWEAIEKFFEDAELKRRPILDLYQRLQAPPYGLKMGVMPVLLCAALLSRDSDVALYEEDVFMPEVTVDAFERLLRRPERFAVRKYRIEGIRRQVFEEMGRLVNARHQTDMRSVVSVVRPLYRFFARLPKYSKKTKNLSAEALAVRAALLDAREPDLLLFRDLPKACNFEGFDPTERDTANVESYFAVLRVALGELQRCYEDLLAGLRATIMRVFSATGESARRSVRERAECLVEHCVENRLRAFVLHLADDHSDETAWIEAVATMVAGKAPDTWDDNDRARFEITAAELARKVRHIEVLAFEQQRRESAGRSADQLLRIGVADRHSRETETVVAVEAVDVKLLAETMDTVRERLANLEHKPELRLAAIAKVAQQYIAELQRNAPDVTEHGSGEALGAEAAYLGAFRR